MDELILEGAREHNLEGVDLTIPRDSLVTFTGVSGVSDFARQKSSTLRSCGP
jgi:excinuclease UvrABC ATPase subunit